MVLPLAVAALLTAATARAESELVDQIRAMVTASQRMDYQGVLVHGMPTGVESMHLYHAGAKDGRYRERLVMLTGPERELVRDGSSVRRYHPSSGRVVTGPQRRGSGIFKLAREDLVRVRDHYQLRSGPRGRVAGRQARAVEFRAQDDKRFSYRIWWDRDTDLPLQTEVLGADRQVRETFMFAVVEPGTRPRQEDLALSAPEGAAQARRERLPEPDGTDLLAGLELPPGFQLEGRYSGADGTGEHFFYSDGLATLSVFLDPRRGAPDGNGKGCKILERGALHACSIYRQGRRVTFLGEVPAAALRGIAASVAGSDQ